MKIPGAFWETLGPHYVYGYKEEDTDSWKYIGKAVGNRVTHHVAEKGYDLEDAYILAKNLADDKTAAAVESLLISIHQPTDNIVKGHHTERFEVSKLKGLFKGFADSQRNYHFEKGEFLERHRETFYSSLGGANSSGQGFTLYSSLRDATQTVINVSKDGIQFQFKVYQTTNAELAEDLFEKLKEIIVGPLSENYELSISPAKSGGIISFYVETEDEAIDLWSDFNS